MRENLFYRFFIFIKRDINLDWRAILYVKLIESLAFRKKF
nr:MAG TPA: hypothetical protein [Caudoviricetes sp.]